MAPYPLSPVPNQNCKGRLNHTLVTVVVIGIESNDDSDNDSDKEGDGATQSNIVTNTPPLVLGNHVRASLYMGLAPNVCFL